MKYTELEFLSLIQTVEKHGGVFLDEIHSPREELVPILSLNEETEAFEPTGKKIRIKVKACGERALFTLPYTTIKGEQKPVVLCAVCDNLADIQRLDDGEDKDGIIVEP